MKTIPDLLSRHPARFLVSHEGLFRYTIGQRKGLGISNERPLYVVGLDATGNRVIVGENEELFQQRIRVEKFHWLSNRVPDTTLDYQVRIRYSHKGSTAKIRLDGNGFGNITFNEPQRAVTPGQFAVIYHGTELLGSGIIL